MDKQLDIYSGVILMEHTPPEEEPEDEKYLFPEVVVLTPSPANSSTNGNRSRTLSYGARTENLPLDTSLHSFSQPFLPRVPVLGAYPDVVPHNTDLLTNLDDGIDCEELNTSAQSYVESEAVWEEDCWEGDEAPMVFLFPADDAEFTPIDTIDPSSACLPAAPDAEPAPVLEPATHRHASTYSSHSSTSFYRGVGSAGSISSTHSSLSSLVFGADTYSLSLADVVFKQARPNASAHHTPVQRAARRTRGDIPADVALEREYVNARTESPVVSSPCRPSIGEHQRTPFPLSPSSTTTDASAAPTSTLQSSSSSLGASRTLSLTHARITAAPTTHVVAAPTYPAPQQPSTPLFPTSTTPTALSVAVTTPAISTASDAASPRVPLRGSSTHQRSLPLARLPGSPSARSTALSSSPSSHQFATPPSHPMPVPVSPTPTSTSPSRHSGLTLARTRSSRSTAPRTDSLRVLTLDTSPFAPSLSSHAPESSPLLTPLSLPCAHSPTQPAAAYADLTMGRHVGHPASAAASSAGSSAHFPPSALTKSARSHHDGSPPSADASFASSSLSAPSRPPPFAAPTQRPVLYSHVTADHKLLASIPAPSPPTTVTGSVYAITGAAEESTTHTPAPTAASTASATLTMTKPAVPAVPGFPASPTVPSATVALTTTVATPVHAPTAHPPSASAAATGTAATATATTAPAHAAAVAVPSLASLALSTFAPTAAPAEAPQTPVRGANTLRPSSAATACLSPCVSLSTPASPSAAAPMHLSIALLYAWPPGTAPDTRTSSIHTLNLRIQPHTHVGQLRKRVARAANVHEALVCFCVDPALYTHDMRAAAQEVQLIRSIPAPQPAPSPRASSAVLPAHGHAHAFPTSLADQERTRRDALRASIAARRRNSQPGIVDTAKLLSAGAMARKPLATPPAGAVDADVLAARVCALAPVPPEVLPRDRLCVEAPYLEARDGELLARGQRCHEGVDTLSAPMHVAGTRTEAWSLATHTRVHTVDGGIELHHPAAPVQGTISVFAPRHTTLRADHSGIDTAAVSGADTSQSQAEPALTLSAAKGGSPRAGGALQPFLHAVSDDEEGELPVDHPSRLPSHCLPLKHISPRLRVLVCDDETPVSTLVLPSHASQLDPLISVSHVIALVYPLPRANTLMPLFVSSPLTGQLNLYAALADTGAALKRQVYGLTGLHPSTFALVYRDRLLRSHPTLHAQGVQPGTTLELSRHYTPANALRSRSVCALAIEPPVAAHTLPSDGSVVAAACAENDFSVVRLSTNVDAVVTATRPILMWVTDNGDYAHHVLCPALHARNARVHPGKDNDIAQLSAADYEERVPCLCAACDEVCRCVCVNPHGCADDGVHEHYEFPSLASCVVPTYAATAPTPAARCLDHHLCSYSHIAHAGPDADPSHTYVPPSPVPCPVCAPYLSPHLASVPLLAPGALSRRTCFLIDCDSGEVVLAQLRHHTWADTADSARLSALVSDAHCATLVPDAPPAQLASSLGATVRSAVLDATQSVALLSHISDHMHRDLSPTMGPALARFLAARQPTSDDLVRIATRQPTRATYPPPPYMITSVVPCAPLTRGRYYALVINYANYPSLHAAQRWRHLTGDADTATLFPAQVWATIREYEDSMASIVLPSIVAAQPSAPRHASANNAATGPISPRPQSARAADGSGALARRAGDVTARGRAAGSAWSPLQTLERFHDNILFRFFVA